MFQVAFCARNIFRNGIIFKTRKKVWRLIPSSQMEFYAKKKVVRVSIKRILLSVQWDYERMFHHELLPSDHTINNKKYYTRLDQLKASLIFRKKYLWRPKMKSCKFWKDFITILFVSTIIKLDKNFQD